MKRFIIAAALCLVALPAFAAPLDSRADASPAVTSTPPTASTKPSCGSTAQECQAKVDDLTQQLKEASATIAGLRVQRDRAAQLAAEIDLQGYVSQQAPKPK